MPRFRKGVATSPLLPAHDANSLGLIKKKSSSSVWASLGEAGLALVIAGTLFAVIIYTLMSLEAHRSAALDNRSTRELPGTDVPMQNAALKQRLDALIEEASNIAQEQGILTEVDAAENARLRELNKQDDWNWVLDENNYNTSNRIKEQIVTRANAGQCSSGNSDVNKECGPHGVCIDNQCSCAVAFSGTFCGHTLLLSHPYTPEKLSVAQLGYEGDYLLLQNSKLEQIKEESDIEKVRHLLPLADTIFKAQIFESCAVVGDSGSLLLNKQYCAAIDSHSFIFRTGEVLPHVSTIKDHYKEYTGAKSGVHVVTTLPEKNREQQGQTTSGKKVILLAPPSFENLDRLRSYSAAFNQFTTHIIHPKFVQHVQNLSFSRSTTVQKQNLSFSTNVETLETAILLALNTCRSVAVFGLVPVPKLPPTYYNICSSYSTEALQQQQLNKWVLQLKNYFDAGLIHFGEPCIVECVLIAADDEKNSCEVCRKEHNLNLEPLVSAMKAECDST